MADFMSRIVRFCLISLSFLLSALVLASDFGDAPDKGIKVIVDSDSQSNAELTNDILIMNPPNASGVSYNNITKFAVTRHLKIINTADGYGSATSKAAKLIIIRASQISINNKIELVGETADILLLTDSPTSPITCTNCNFINFGRLSLVAAVPTLDSSNLPLEFVPQDLGRITINGLSTTNVASTELIANRISLSGLINTQQKAIYTSDGTYQLNPSGSLIIGSGGVNVFAGYTLGYSDLKLKRATASSASLTFASNTKITSQSVHIVSSNPFVHNGEINTKSDAISIANYRNNVSAIEERVEIYGLDLDASITANGTINTDGATDIQSSTNITVNGQINTKHQLILTSGAKLIHRGKSNFHTAYITAKEIENNGQLYGEILRAESEGQTQNRFGGKILTNDIQLVSKTSSVRNGSQYPFKPQSDVPLVLKPDSVNNIGLGTIDGLPYSNATKVSDLTAVIMGKNVVIAAAGNVENINPYFVYTPDSNAWDNGIPFNPHNAEQVQLIAENSLKIQSGSFVLNSSAIMGVNSINGQFWIVSPYVTNERYNTQVVIQSFEDSSSTGTTSTSVTGTEAALIVFSPPGVIYSFAPLGFYFNAENGGFINNMGYFEVLNDAEFSNQDAFGNVKPSKVTSIGIKLEKQLAGKTVVNTRTLEECLNSYPPSERYSYQAQMRCHYSPNITTYTNLQGNTDEIMQGTLFSVKGKINGLASDFYGTNHRTTEEQRNLLINQYIADNTGQTGTFSVDYTGTTYTPAKHTNTYNYVQKAQLSADGKSINIIYEGTLASRNYSTSNGDYGLWAFSEQKTMSKTARTVSVAEYLKAKFLEVKNALIETYNAFMAWLTA